MDRSPPCASSLEIHHVRPSAACELVVKTQIGNKPVERALGIGVGLASLEREVTAFGVIKTYDCYDVSQGGLDAAEAAATEMGIGDKMNFICADINTVELPENHYDVITFMASLHHIDKLKETLLQCQKALAPGGVLWAFEYVGPDRFAYPDEHADIARTVYRLLDPDMHLPGEPN